ncbi:putative calreticulin [Monocercomonoides exilis]|uniref:putative calreticulin n=1 Tax=Monocercomonoides exilis TaxID=2049356 RepID=UPI00355A1FAB|nr:putative calreticulin [Monocercomonoides exilis]|eukprot:MONOS_7924.1-p1 / transcript=MONOS_7924.1 / gene=MONOS_7924 / organism=Monocercomonoides_exilis_PA203 / gene_product=calreticulin / transcript_product=calreticulin / location=Mono_scaffold00285:36183-37663(-) / protein_length=412 / sequence_SO=supercontig / SO=protein_coding / is_pseudo=false
MLLIFCFLIGLHHSKVYFKEEFDYTWPSRWMMSNVHAEDGKQGKFTWEAPEKAWHPENAKGLKTSQDEKYYMAVADIGETVTNFKKDLFIGFTLVQTKQQKCSGSYIKFLPEGANVKNFTNETEYQLMFGPDFCGMINDHIHVIVKMNGTEYPLKNKIKTVKDNETHLYALKLYRNGTYKVQLDNHTESEGDISEQWEWFPTRLINDTNATKPDDWAEEEEILDMNDTKPADWDQPKLIPDPDAVKPADWDENDGKWIAPLMRNPKYKGTWKRRMIKNPAYVGEWKPPLIPNPEYNDEVMKAKAFRFRYIAIDIWQVESGSIYDNFIICDKEAEFDSFLAATFRKQRNIEHPGWEKDLDDDRRREEEYEKEKAENQKKNKKNEDDDGYFKDDEESVKIPSGDDYDEWYLDDI